MSDIWVVRPWEFAMGGWHRNELKRLEKTDSPLHDASFSIQGGRLTFRFDDPILPDVKGAADKLYDYLAELLVQYHGYFQQETPMSDFGEEVQDTWMVDPDYSLESGRRILMRLEHYPYENRNYCRLVIEDTGIFYLSHFVNERSDFLENLAAFMEAEYQLPKQTFTNFIVGQEQNVALFDAQRQIEAEYRIQKIVTHRVGFL